MRLIDADELIKELRQPTGLSADCERCACGLSLNDECVDCIIEDVIQHIPTVELVKHGKWEDVGNKEFKCSECGIVLGGAYCYVYCPHCGSKML